MNKTQLIREIAIELYELLEEEYESNLNNASCDEDVICDMENIMQHALNDYTLVTTTAIIPE